MNKWGYGIVAVSAIVLFGASCVKQPTVVPSNQTSGNLTTDGLQNTVATPNSTPSTTKPATKTVTVNYTGSEFSPKSITINVGDTVKFVNTGTTSAVWPAANPHPIHTSVSGFDAKQPLDTGGTYAFTFTKVQTVGYHNHLNPSETGTIIVK